MSASRSTTTLVSSLTNEARPMSQNCEAVQCSTDVELLVWTETVADGTSARNWRSTRGKNPSEYEGAAATRSRPVPNSRMLLAADSRLFKPMNERSTSR
jgi:hypothetical protein